MSTVGPTANSQIQATGRGDAEGHAGNRVPRALLALLRIYLGVVFLVAAWPKLTAAGGFQPRFEAFVQNAALPSAHGFYRGFLESVVLPNSALFTPLVVYGELAVGLALLVGAATRLAAAAAMLFLLNYMLAKGMWFWTPASNDAALFFTALVVLLGAAGRSFGLDRLLQRRYPSAGVW